MSGRSDSYEGLMPAEIYKLDFGIFYSQTDNLKLFLISMAHFLSALFRTRQQQLNFSIYLYDMDMNQRKLYLLYNMSCCIQYSIHILECMYIIQSHNLLHILVQGLNHYVKHVNLVGFHGNGRSPSRYPC